jgi:transcriptional regulator with GAF, ATPase, and Fis domain
MEFDERETISAPVEAAQAAALAEAVVAVRIHATQREIDLPADRRRVTVGAGTRCDVIIDDDVYVSTVHCTLERRDDGRTVVRDRRSKNGTFLNGNRVEAAEVGPGALLGLGRTRLVLLGDRGRGRLTAYEQLIGNDAGFRAAVDTTMRAASSDVSVLIIGETGTGKELVARAVHEASPRSARPFVAINCGAIPRELIGSELFGHEKGAFTGAANAREGAFMRADGGTLFLDELGELPGEQQPHLLRVLETRMVRRIGSDDDRPVDVRLVTATNRLESPGSESARVRLDLYHRVATVVVSLPPLRERAGDVPLLVRWLLRQLGGERHGRTVSRATMAALSDYSWPGNVRELRHAVQRAMALCDAELTVDHLLPPGTPQPPQLHPLVVAARRRRNASWGAGDQIVLSPIDALLRDTMLDYLDRHGSIRRAARALGMPKSTFADHATRFGIIRRRE